MLASRRRKIFVALGTLSALAVGAIAVAYFTGADGTGSGGATVGSSTAWSVAVTPGSATYTPSGYTAIYPGSGTEAIPFTVTNNGKGAQNLKTLSYAIKNDGGNPAIAETSNGTVITGCQAGWFSAGADSGNQSPGTLSPGAAYSGKVDVTMSDSGTSQDPCQGASPGVVVTASSS
jgi:hypothetical protein